MLKDHPAAYIKQTDLLQLLHNFSKKEKYAGDYFFCCRASYSNK